MIRTFRCGWTLANRCTRHSWTFKRRWFVIFSFYDERDVQLVQAAIKFGLNKIFVHLYNHRTGQKNCYLASIILHTDYMAQVVVTSIAYTAARVYIAFVGKYWVTYSLILVKYSSWNQIGQSITKVQTIFYHSRILLFVQIVHTVG